MRETTDAEGNVLDGDICVELLAWTSVHMRARTDIDDRGAVLDLLDDETS